jgi:hypothetical protein
MIATPHDAGLILDTVPLTLYTPWSRPPAHLALEIVVVGIGVATLVHALRARRRGDTLPVFTWITIFVYGVAMELLSYNFVENFVHAQFSVMFYHRKLPLYVTAVYPTLLYTGIATARRFGLPSWAEGFAAGLCIVALDIPFDIIGPKVHWWSWSAVDPLLAYRWCGVPVTSYYWHLAFGGVLAALTSAISPHVQRPRQLLLTLPAALLTIVLGTIAFLPLHGLAAVGVSHGITVAIAWMVSVAVLLVAPKQRSPIADRLLLAFPLVFLGLHLAIGIGVLPMTHLIFALSAVGFSLVVNVAVHGPSLSLRRRATAGG